MSAVRGEAILTEDHEQGDVVAMTFLPESTTEILVSRYALERLIAEVNDFRRLRHALRVVR